MLLTGFFDGLGQALGTVIRWIVDSLSGAFGLLGSASNAFIGGLSRTLGITPSLLSLSVLLLGLFLLYRGVRAFMRSSFIAGSLLLLLGLWLLSMLII
jgi:ABC-type proline/glycine betaine transport system permease subunit